MPSKAAFLRKSVLGLLTVGVEWEANVWNLLTNTDISHKWRLFIFVLVH